MEKWTDLLTEDFPKDYTYEEREPGLYQYKPDVAETLRDMLPFSSLLTKGLGPDTAVDTMSELGSFLPGLAALKIGAKKIPGGVAKKIETSMVRPRRLEWPVKLQKDNTPIRQLINHGEEALDIASKKQRAISPKASEYLSPELKERISKEGYTAGTRRDILTSFGTTEERKALIRSNLDRLEQIFKEFGPELKGGRVYASGSFTSSKPNPADIDLVVRFPESLYRKDLESYNSLLNDIATLDRYYSSVAPQIHFVPTENLRHLDKFRTVGKMRYGPDYTWQRLLGLGGAAVPIASLLSEGQPPLE